MKEDKEKCIKAGMDDYISKPINSLELLRVIQKQLIKTESNESHFFNTFHLIFDSIG